jgi:ankyrin repeat protein
VKLLRPGDPVVLIASGEFGVVVHTWPSDVGCGIADHYVAFFGKSFPLGKPSRVPYVLRYAATSLRAVVTDEIGGRVRWRLPLLAAVEENHLKAMRIFLREGVEQEVIDKALRWAVVRGNTAAMRLLLRHGADVNALANDGGTPLMRAVYNPKASRDVVTGLLNAGARINESIDVKFTAPPRQHRQRTALHYAASVAPSDVVELLLATGADPNVADKKGITPLMIAAANGRPEVAKALLNAGADAAAKDKKSLTALAWAKHAMDSQAPELRAGGKRIASMLRSSRTRKGVRPK